jgi:hypothetical protein
MLLELQGNFLPVPFLEVSPAPQPLHLHAHWAFYTIGAFLLLSHTNSWPSQGLGPHLCGLCCVTSLDFFFLASNVKNPTFLLFPVYLLFFIFIQSTTWYLNCIFMFVFCTITLHEGRYWPCHSSPTSIVSKCPSLPLLLLNVISDLQTFCQSGCKK